MKNMKKVFALVLVAVMVLALSATAFAASISNKTDHEYDVYQIFSGNQTDSTSTILSDIEWGNGINFPAFLTALKADSRFVKDGKNVFADAESAADVAKILGENSGMAGAFAKVADANKGKSTATIGKEAIQSDLASGYYLFVDKTVTDGADDAKNVSLLQITNNITIEEKYSVPTLDKDIVDNNINVEAADCNIGDTVTFELRGTLPTNYSDYTTYKYAFHDTLSKGLTYQGDVKVYKDSVADANEIKSLFDTTTSESGIDITAENLKKDASITKDTTIIVRYTAKLNENAKIGSEGNPNKAYLEFSNNPNSDGDGKTGKTPEDEVIVFTYELDTTKIDADTGAKLEGVTFYLKNSADKYVKVDDAGKVTGWADSKEGATLLTSDAQGLFKVIGIDEGTYYLEENTTLAGYNKLDGAIKIEITSEITGSVTKDHDSVTPALTSLTLKVNDKEAKGEDGNAADYSSTGVLPVTVENEKGATLPTTGGIGTTIFYVLGSILVLVAGVVLITRRRMNND